MALSDSMFLLEIDIQDFKSYTHFKKFKIIGQFADVFKISLKSPTIKTHKKKSRTKNVKQRENLKKSYLKLEKSESKLRNNQASQSILLVSELSELIYFMKEHPLEILISKANDFDQPIGSAVIPWSNEYINYLSKDHMKSVCPPAYTKREYNVYDGLTSRKIATINMSLKLTALKDKLRSHLGSLCNKPDIFTDIGKYNMMKKESLIDSDTNVVDSNSKRESESLNKLNNSRRQHITCIKSELDIANEPKNTVFSVKSCSSIDYKQKNNLFSYIFGDPMGNFGSKVYQVSYFTVEPDVSEKNSPKDTSGVQSPEKSTESKRNLTFKKCDSECLTKKETGSCPDSDYTLDLPEEVAHLTNVTKCKELTCNYKKHRELPPPPDDRVLLDLTNLKTVCCTEVKEEVVSGVIAKMKIGHDPCFCSCECGLFSSKKTTYCTICGGYEKVGEDVTGKAAHEAPMPCPIFHKLVDKNKLKTWSTSGSESKKKGDEQRSARSVHKSSIERRSAIIEKKSVESDKNKKKKKDDRFKFNYGYKGIPPQIGHSQCAFPCTGTLDNVPKRMGWLWSAENVPGMKVPDGWKPGAISKKILRMLNKAKSHKSSAETVKRTKRTKKQVEDKPTLIVCKHNGQYHVELQATTEKPDEFNDQCTPLIYRIESLDNRAKLKKKEKIQRRLVKAAVTEVWSDPYHPEACENVCIPAYKQAVGCLPDGGDDRLVLEEHRDDSNSYSCDDEEISSSCDSSEIDWEIHFTPPFVSHQKVASQENNELVV